MKAPEPATREQAIAWVQETRRARDALISEVSEGNLDLPAAVSRATSDPATAGLRVVVLLESLPGVGKVAARRALRDLGIGDHRPIGELEPDDVAALTEVSG